MPSMHLLTTRYSTYSPLLYHILVRAALSRTVAALFKIHPLSECVVPFSPKEKPDNSRGANGCDLFTSTHR